MKRCSLFFLLIQSLAALHAQIPSLPLTFELSTTKESYFEGEKIEFILTVTNTDTKNTWPVITPGDQNYGNKLITLRAVVHAENFQIAYAEESRELNMSIDDFGFTDTVLLKPGQKTEIHLFLNDPDNYSEKTESHHSLDLPLYAGMYKIQAIYCPYELPRADSLYDFLPEYKRSLSNTKINFPKSGVESNLCELKIRKAKPGIINIDGITYSCIDRKMLPPNQYLYFRKTGKDSTLAHSSIVPVNDYHANSEVTYINDSITLWITRFGNGNIESYNMIRSRCPDDIYMREWYNDSAIKKTVIQLEDGTLRTYEYFEDGRIKYYSVWSGDGKVLTETNCRYTKKGKRKKDETIVTENPCVMKML